MNIKKKVIIIVSILLIVSILAIVVFASNDKNELAKDFDNENSVNEVCEVNELDEEKQNIIDDEIENISNENVVTNEEKEEQPEITTNKVENTVEQKNAVTQKTTQSTTTQSQKQEDKKLNNSKVQETKEKTNTQQTTSYQESQSTKKVDLSKYSYYEKATDGSYKAFLIDRAEINKLKGLIDNAINNFGYKNIKIIEDSSLSKDGTMYFTANKTNVENAVYDSEGFTIYYYAVKEYLISANGTENYFQTRSYIKVK